MSIRNQQKEFVSKKHSFTDRGDLLEFVRTLQELGLVFHYDVYVKDVPAFTRRFDESNLKAFQDNIDRMLETANRLHVDVFEYHNRLLGRNDPDSEYYESKTEKFETDTVQMKNMYVAILCLMDKAHNNFHTDFNRDEALKGLQDFNCVPGSMYELLAFEEAVEEVIGVNSDETFNL